MTPRRGPTRHVFVEADPPDVDGLGVHWCVACNLPFSNRVHDLPERDEDERAAEARKLGER